MKADRVLTRLSDHQRQIRSILIEVRSPLAGEGADSIKRIALARWQLMRLLREYQLFKHTEVFDPLIGNADPERSSAAWAMKARCTMIGDAYSDHVRKWTLKAPISAWSEYQQEAVAMSERILAHLRQEAEDAERLLAGVYRTRKPEGA